MMAAFENFIVGPSLIVSGIIVMIISRYILKKNEEGMEVYKHIHGFKTFVQKADKDRLETLLNEDPGYFEKTLPYAIAFGMAKKWTNQFTGLFTTPPDWYHGDNIDSNHNDFQHFSSNFDSGISNIESAFVSSPSSDGGSGGGCADRFPWRGRGVETAEGLGSRRFDSDHSTHHSARCRARDHHEYDQYPRAHPRRSQGDSDIW